MNRTLKPFTGFALLICLALGSGLVSTPALAASKARGTVFHDQNNNGTREADESGIAGLLVSNGREIVPSDAHGRWTLPLTDDAVLFVITGKGWAAPLDARGLPRFYYIHKPNGSPNTRYPGQARTGPLPASIEFPLLPAQDADAFSIFVMGDPQPRNQEQVDYLARDVISEMAQVQGPLLGISLGDIASDDLSLYDPINDAMRLIGLPWYNVPGNHDVNYDVDRDEDSDESFSAIYGPPSYAFQRGKVHFLILDDVIYQGQARAEEIKTRKLSGQRPYVGGFREDQFRFIENYLRHVPRDHLVVLNMHIPLFQRRTSYYEGIESFRKADRERLFALLKQHPHSLSLSAHTHFQQQTYFKAADGWLQDQPHHHVNLGAACGDWFSGLPTYDGFPDATMRDGTPNGYALIHFDGNDYRIRYKVAGADASKQMSLHLPYPVTPAALMDTAIYANVYMGSEYTRVWVRFTPHERWLEMHRSYEPDPRTRAMFDYQSALFAALPPELATRYRRISEPQPTEHLWKAALPTDLPRGFHLAEVRALQRSGEEYQERISFRVE
ncbi:MAG: calcineurin-like phosphoesterase C-terminal domain-containing protein [Panacagrimonas sp.]